MWVKVDYSSEAKKNPIPNMPGEWAIYTKKHWWNKWVERNTYADLDWCTRDAEKLVKYPKYWHNIKIEDIFSWLEKHSYTKKDIDDAYLKGVKNTKNEIEKQYEANYQIRKDIAAFIFNYRGDIKDRAKWMDYLGIKVSFVEKQGEQNH